MAYKTTSAVTELLNTESNTYIKGNFTFTDRNIKTDAFDRVRVGLPITLFEINSIFNKNHTIGEVLSGSGESTHVDTNSYISMTVSDTGVGKVIRQSYEYVPYQPGKSRFMIFTGVLEISGGVEGCVSRIGCFDSSVDKTVVTGVGNGLFFELNGTNMYVVERLNDVDTKVIQSSWNVDKLDGTGPSGYTLNEWSKAHIFAIEQEWLGVGMVRFSLIINGAMVPIHIFTHSGLGEYGGSAITMPYAKMGKLPVRYEIRSSSPVNAEMRMICATVLSEGGFELYGFPYSYPRTTAKSASTTATVPILSIKLKEDNGSEYNRMTILIKNVSMLNSGNNKFGLYKLYELQSKSALTGASWSSINANSGVQVDTSATAVNTANSRLVKSGYISESSNHNFDSGNYFISPLLNSHIDGTSRVLCLTATGIGGTITMYASFDWLEIQ